MDRWPTISEFATNVNAFWMSGASRSTGTQNPLMHSLACWNIAQAGLCNCARQGRAPATGNRERSSELRRPPQESWLLKTLAVCVSDRAAHLADTLWNLVRDPTIPTLNIEI